MKCVDGGHIDRMRWGSAGGRLILHGLTVLSLIMGFAMGLLWLRSYDYRDSWMSGKAGGALWAARFLEGKCELTSAAPWFYDESGYFNNRNGFNGGLMFGNVGCACWSWQEFYGVNGRAAWATRPTGEAYRASEELQGDFLFDEHGMGEVAVAQFHQFGFPLWAGTGVFFVLPAWRFGAFGLRAYQRRVRRMRGNCVACGYDLRATPGRCPECGTVLPSQDKSGVVD